MGQEVQYFNHTAGVRSLFGTSIHLPHYSYMNIGIFWSCGPENAVHIKSGIARFFGAQGKWSQWLPPKYIMNFNISQLFTKITYILLSILKLLSAES